MTAEPPSPVPVLAAQPRLLTLRLSIMMFLQWGMFGLWAPLAGMFILAKVEEGGLGFSQYQLGWLLGISGSIGALAAPFIAGQIADRYFSTQRLMGVILVIGGVLWWIMSEQKVFGAWLALSITGSLALAPTGALSNSLAFAHMSNPTKQFPVVRVWGTIGWIVAMWVFAWVWLRQTFVLSSGFPFILLHESVELTWKPMFLMGREHADVVARMVQSLKAGAVVAFVYAAYCLTLPNTPPKRDAAEKLAFWKAFRLFRYRSFLVLMVAALLIACIHNIFFMQTANHLRLLGLTKADIGPAMTIGQVTEIVMIAILGWIAVPVPRLDVAAVVGDRPQPGVPRHLLRLLLRRRLHLRGASGRRGHPPHGPDALRNPDRRGARHWRCAQRRPRRQVHAGGREAQLHRLLVHRGDHRPHRDACPGPVLPR